MSSRYSYRKYYTRRPRPQYSSGVRKPRTKYRAGSHKVGHAYGSRPLAIGNETKDINISISGSTPTVGANAATVSNQNLTTGFVICNLVQQGNTPYMRDGNVIAGVHLGIRFQLQPGANTELSDSVVRWMVILDRSPNATAPTLGTILNDTSEAGVATTTFNSGLNQDHRERFLIMRQGNTELSKISGPQALTNVSISCPLYGLQTGYNGTANPMTSAQIYANAIYLVIVSRMTGAGTLPTINEFLSRYTFKEK